MPKGDILPNGKIARYPENGGDFMSDCNCGCKPPEKPDHICVYPQGYWCPPPPPPYPEYPYPCPPVNVGVGSIEAQIAKLSKKSATIRAMIDGLVNKNKPIQITIGKARYNFGTYLDKEDTETEYGTAVLEMLQAELEAIKAKIVELTSELEVTDETDGVEGTVTNP